MNAAAKAVTQGAIFRGEYRVMHLTKQGLLSLLLVTAVTFSAMAVIYLKNTQRQWFAQVQLLQQQAYDLRLEKNNLLLEQSTSSTPARVQYMANQRLDMVLPSANQVVLLWPGEMLG